jgi:hypothetical protein
MLTSFCKSLVVLSLMLVALGATAGEVYKWTDKDGKVHFSSKPPKDKQAKVEVKDYKGAINSQAAPTKEIPPEVREMMQGMQKALLEVHEDGTPLNCESAPRNINWQVDTLLAQGKKNLEAGYITRDQYDFATGAFKKARDEVSLEDCKTALSTKRSFYQCMSSDKNHVTGCGQKYNY